MTFNIFKKKILGTYFGDERKIIFPPFQNTSIFSLLFYNLFIILIVLQLKNFCLSRRIVVVLQLKHTLHISRGLLGSVTCLLYIGRSVSSLSSPSLCVLWPGRNLKGTERDVPKLSPPTASATSPIHCPTKLC